MMPFEVGASGMAAASSGSCLMTWLMLLIEAGACVGMAVLTSSNGSCLMATLGIREDHVTTFFALVLLSSSLIADFLGSRQNPLFLLLTVSGFQYLKFF